LKSFGVPIPQPDPKALAWMTAEQNAPRPKETPVHRAMGMLHNGPDVHTTAQSGRPQMEPEADNGPTETLSGGNRTTLVSSGGGGSPSSSGSTAVVETVRPGDPAPAGAAGAEDTSSGTGDNSGGTATTNGDGTAGSTTDAAPATDAAKTDPPAADSASKTATPAAADANNNQKESSSKKKGLKKLIPW